MYIGASGDFSPALSSSFSWAESSILQQILYSTSHYGVPITSSEDTGVKTHANAYPQGWTFWSESGLEGTPPYPSQS